MPTAASGKLDGGAIDWLLYLVAAMGWPLAFLVAVAVTLLALGRKAAEKAAEKAVEHTFAKAGKDYELSAGRRSAFVQRVLTDRWEAVEDLFARLQRITTNLNRSRTGHAVPSDFFDAGPSGQEVVPLTVVFEDLEIRRLLLGERFHGLLSTRAQLVLALANFLNNEAAFNELAGKLQSNAALIRAEVELQFKTSQILFEQA
jgi:hypothetical protein